MIPDNVCGVCAKLTLNNYNSTIQVLDKNFMNLIKKMDSELYELSDLAHYSLNMGLIKSTEYLLKTFGKEIDIDKPNSMGITPITMACLMQNYKMVELLCQNGAQINTIKQSYPISPMELMIKRSRSCIIKMLTKYGTNGNNDNQDQFQLAKSCFTHKLEMVKLLVENGADINHNRNTPTAIEAAVHGHLAGFPHGIEMISYLISLKPRPLSWNLESSIFFLLKGDRYKPNNPKSLQILKMLLQANLIFDFFDNIIHPKYPIISAIRHDYNLFAEMLIRLGEDINKRNKRNHHCLMTAIRLNRYHLAKLIIISKRPILNSFERMILLDRIEMVPELKACFYPEKYEKFNLQYLCRATIRKHLGLNADQIIEQWPHSNHLKPYLLLKSNCNSFQLDF